MYHNIEKLVSLAYAIFSISTTNFLRIRIRIAAITRASGSTRAVAAMGSLVQLEVVQSQVHSLSPPKASMRFLPSLTRRRSLWRIWFQVGEGRFHRVEVAGNVRSSAALVPVEWCIEKPFGVQKEGHGCGRLRKHFSFSVMKREACSRFRDA